MEAQIDRFQPESKWSSASGWKLCQTMLPLGSIVDNMNRMDIPKIIKESRKKLFKSAGEAADSAGISRGHWANFESGGRVPMPDNVEAIAKTIRLTDDQTAALLHAAIQRHESEMTKKVLADLEAQIANNGKKITELQRQLRDVVGLLRQRGIKLPDSCVDIG